MNYLEIGDPITDSPVGPGRITGFTDRGYPRVNGVAVVYCVRSDGAIYDPHSTDRKPHVSPTDSDG